MILHLPKFCQVSSRTWDSPHYCEHISLPNFLMFSNLSGMVVYDIIALLWGRKVKFLKSIF